MGRSARKCSARQKEQLIHEIDLVSDVRRVGKRYLPGLSQCKSRCFARWAAGSCGDEQQMLSPGLLFSPSTCLGTFLLTRLERTSALALQQHDLQGNFRSIQASLSKVDCVLLTAEKSGGGLAPVSSPKISRTLCSSRARAVATPSACPCGCPCPCTPPALILLVATGVSCVHATRASRHHSHARPSDKTQTEPARRTSTGTSRDYACSEPPHRAPRHPSTTLTKSRDESM
eukprot:6209963-Pleurochrysis_carterae.AAC.1